MFDEMRLFDHQKLVLCKAPQIRRLHYGMENKVQTAFDLRPNSQRKEKYTAIQWTLETMTSITDFELTFMQMWESAISIKFFLDVYVTDTWVENKLK